MANKTKAAEREVYFGEPKLHGYLLAALPDSTETATATKNVNNEAIRKVGIIVSHPHPKFGGNQHNNVVLALCTGFQKLGYSTLRFNTRGVGKSKGWSSLTGASEVEDIKAAIIFLNQQPEIEKVIFIGYSFGSAVGFAAVHDLLDSSDENKTTEDTANAHLLSIAASVAVSYPRGFTTSCMFYRHYKVVDNPTPKFFVIGDRDDFTSESTLRTFVEESVSEPKTLEIIQGVDHFWFGKENKLFEAIKTFLASHSLL